MNLESIILSEISQTEKGQYHMISLICLLNLPPHDEFIDTENDLVVIRGRGGQNG